jgi:amine acid ABC transporter, permease protein, 3-TM region, His/Glu/Gln/Arg/opine family
MTELLTTYLPDLLSGLWVTTQITVVAFVGSMLFGSVLAVFRISPILPLRVAAGAFVEVFRNVPLVALVVLVVYGLPEIGINPGFLPGVILATTAVGTAFACETLRSGANAVDAGQIEAARSVGLTFSGIMRFILIPQARARSSAPW